MHKCSAYDKQRNQSSKRARLQHTVLPLPESCAPPTFRRPAMTAFCADRKAVSEVCEFDLCTGDRFCRLGSVDRLPARFYR